MPVTFRLSVRERSGLHLPSIVNRERQLPRAIAPALQ
jgi:hypothetical protein